MRRLKGSEIVWPNGAAFRVAVVRTPGKYDSFGEKLQGLVHFLVFSANLRFYQHAHVLLTPVQRGEQRVSKFCIIRLHSDSLTIFGIMGEIPEKHSEEVFFFGKFPAFFIRP